MNTAQVPIATLQVRGVRGSGAAGLPCISQIVNVIEHTANLSHLTTHARVFKADI